MTLKEEIARIKIPIPGGHTYTLGYENADQIIEAFNKIVPEKHDSPITPEFKANDDGFNQCVDQIERAMK